MTTVLPGGLVEFRFFRPHASEVFVAGSFNGWNVRAAPMHQSGDGWWRSVLSLPDGEYKFRYVADGQWFTDYAANGVERSRHAWNSMLLVRSPRSVAA